MTSTLTPPSAPSVTDRRNARPAGLLRWLAFLGL
jgi:hypothetical protein